MKRVAAPDRTRERLRALMDGRLGTAPDRSNLVLLAAQLIVEEALEAEVRDEVGRERYAPWDRVVLIKQVVGSLWTAHAADKEAEIELYNAAAAALAGIKPKDEIEGMLAAQMVAAHSASMECRRCRHAGGRAKRAAAGRDDQATIARFGSAPPS